MEVNQQNLYFFYCTKINIMMSSILAKLYLFHSKNIWGKNYNYYHAIIIASQHKREQQTSLWQIDWHQLLILIPIALLATQTRMSVGCR